MSSSAWCRTLFIPLIGFSLLLMSAVPALGQTQACCSQSGACMDLPPSQCPGFPAGPGTSCADGSCTERPCCVDNLCAGFFSPPYCESIGGVPQPIGSPCQPGAPCDSGGGECGPRPDGSACQDVTCPNPNHRCAPKCARFNPATGAIEVEDCECRHPEQCHVAVPTGPTQGVVCVVPDAGGTADLPPSCAYTSPDDTMQIIDGLPPGTTIEIQSTLQGGSCTPGNSVCSFPNVCDQPGGSLGGDQHCANGPFPMVLVGTGTLNGFNRNINLPVSYETHSGPRTPGDPVQEFPETLFRLFGQITGDPDFDLLRIVGGTDFGLPSPGHTTLTQVPGGNWAVDSFFDITYRIDFVGAPGGPLAGRSGSTTGTIRMSTGVSAPKCEGQCPPGTNCVRTVVQQPDGSVTICCDCEGPPQQCRPKADGQGCEPVDCGDPNLFCVPVGWGMDTQGLPVVTACDCQDGDECQLRGTPTAPFCSGYCPAGASGPQCREVPNAAGGFDCDCSGGCTGPGDCDDGDACTIDDCDPITGLCIHIAVICDDGDPCTLDTCDPAVGCVHTPINCDDGNPCTVDTCVNGQCVHTPVNCDDGDPCTDDRCDPLTGACLHVPVDCNDNNACTEDFCGPNGCYHVPISCDDGDVCTIDSCDPVTGCVHTPIPGCGEEEAPKWSQTPTPDREDVPSSVWITPNGPVTPNQVIADDFRSDGRPISSVRWWGSYLDSRYAPAQFGGLGQVPYQIDGYLISFHLPLRPTPLVSSTRLLGLYFAPANAVNITPTSIPPCDGHPVFAYQIRLDQCCLIASFPDPRVPAVDPHRCPAQPESFYERRCYWYHLDIQAVIGARWAPIPGANCCQIQFTENQAPQPVWGWHATANEKGRRPALRGEVRWGGLVDSPCPPLNACPLMMQWRYGPWALAPRVCQFQHRIDMAFELLTPDPTTPPACPPVIILHATSIKKHGNPGTDFGIDLPLDPPAGAGIECRQGGPTRVVVKFSEPIYAADESLDPGDEVTTNDGTITSLSIAGDELEVLLTGVSNPKCVQLVVENGPDGITALGDDDLSGDNDVHIRNLTGDVLGNGAVNIFDLLNVRSQLNLPVDAGNFRNDVQVSGSPINIFDLLAVRANLSKTVTCP